jgi:hypothetical protein
VGQPYGSGWKTRFWGGAERPLSPRLNRIDGRWCSLAGRGILSRRSRRYPAQGLAGPAAEDGLRLDVSPAGWRAVG